MALPAASLSLSCHPRVWLPGLLLQGVEVMRIGRQEAVHQALRPHTYGDQPPGKHLLVWAWGAGQRNQEGAGG